MGKRRRRAKGKSEGAAKEMREDTRIVKGSEGGDEGERGVKQR